MSILRLTKNELKYQRDQLNRFNQYLPTLVIKMQQLKLVLNKTDKLIRRKEQEREVYITENNDWIALFGSKNNIEDFIRIKQLTISTENIAGVDVPKFICIDFQLIFWDIFSTPLWYDTAIRYLQRLVSLDIEINILHEQAHLIRKELQTTTQRVNLFEKIRIPKTKANIRMINIYLNDQHIAAVVRGKIAKNNIAIARS